MAGRGLYQSGNTPPVARPIRGLEGGERLPGAAIRNVRQRKHNVRQSSHPRGAPILCLRVGRWTSPPPTKGGWRCHALSQYAIAPGCLHLSTRSPCPSKRLIPRGRGRLETLDGVVCVGTRASTVPVRRPCSCVREGFGRPSSLTSLQAPRGLDPWVCSASPAQAYRLLHGPSETFSQGESASVSRPPG